MSGRGATGDGAALACAISPHSGRGSGTRPRPLRTRDSRMFATFGSVATSLSVQPVMAPQRSLWWPTSP